MNYRKLLIPPILSILFIFGCKSRPQQTVGAAIPNKADSIRRLVESQEKAFMTQSNEVNDTLGRKITTVTFRTNVTKADLKIYEDGIIPWVNLDTPQKRIKNLVNPDEMVIPYQKVVLIIDYPVAKPVFFELTSQSKGFTRKQIIFEISKKYHELYEEEEKTAKIKTIPMGQRKTLANRNETDGKYGIWGHDLSDLDLSSIDIYENADGRIFLSLDIES